MADVNVEIKDEAGLSSATEDAVSPGPDETVELNLRKAVDGSIMIFDHMDIDIVLVPESKKIITMPKDLMTDDVYETQNHLFKHLTRKGLIEYDSIRGGNVYGAFEAKLLESIFEQSDPLQLTILQISKWIDEERPFFESERAYLEREEERLLEPEEEDSTKLGEVPHSSKKGSIRPGWIRGPYGIYDLYRV